MRVAISIIICTLNREEVLCNTLRSVIRLLEGRQDSELIVVDQTCRHTEATENCLNELAKSFRWERVDFASLTRARNHGVRLARGEIILFLDDDVEPSPRLIDEHLACYNKPEIWGVGGCALLPGKRKLSRGDLTSSELREIESNHSNRFDLNWSRITSWASGCNMSFRREKLFEVGGFDEAYYGVAIGEEAELCWRLCQAGGVIVYAPDAELLHLVNPSGGCRDAHKGAEMTAQFLDNQNYHLKRIGKSGMARWMALFSQCRIIAFNRTSLRDGTWIERLKWCWRGLLRALQYTGRVPVLGLLRKALPE